MAFTPIFASGGETGLVGEWGIGTGVATTSEKKTGSYGLYLTNAEYRTYTLASTTMSDLYGGFWVKSDNNYGISVTFNTSDGYIRLWKNGNKLAIFRDATLLATGITDVVANLWHNIQFRVLIHNSTGIVQIYLDGILEINYSGDTQPATGTYILSTMLFGFNSGIGTNNYYDDFVLGTGGFPGDLRIEAVVPNSDSANEWTKSTGATAYGVLDEIPANTTDYISTTTSGLNSIHGHGAWTSTNKIPKYIAVNDYVWQDSVSTSTTITYVDSGGGVLRKSVPVMPPTVAAFHQNILTTYSDGTAWDSTKIDALITGVQSNI